MKSTILAGLLAVGAASAQMTGDWGRAVSMDGGMMYGGTTWHAILGSLLWIGVTLLVWLWVWKLFKEVRKMK